MLPTELHALRDVAYLLWHFPINLIKDQFRIAQNGIQWCAELMTHIGKKLGFMGARNRQSSALLFERARPFQYLVLQTTMDRLELGRHAIKRLSDTLEFVPRHDGQAIGQITTPETGSPFLEMC